MKRVVRNERGFLSEVIVIALIGAALVGAAGAVLVNMSDISRAAEKQAKPVAQIPTINPLVPNGAAARECYLSVGARHRLTWTEQGWRENADHPIPDLTGDLPRDKGALEVWREGLQNYIDDFKFEFDVCDKAPPSENLGKPNPKEEEEKFPYNYSATYTLTILSKTDKCAGFPGQMGVQHINKEVTLTMSFAGATLRPTGTVQTSGYFNASSNDQLDLTKTGVMSSVGTHVTGRFELIDGRPGIRSGQWEGTIDGDTCTVTFEGRT